MESSGPVYALNLFDIVDREEYLAYSRRSAREVAAHGGKPVALGRFREAQQGDIAPRQVLILVEWESREARSKSLRHALQSRSPFADLPPFRDIGTRRVSPEARIVGKPRANKPPFSVENGGIGETLLAENPPGVGEI